MFGKIFRIIAGFVFASMMSSAALAGSGIDLTVEGIRNNKGKVIVLVFDSAKEFASDNGEPIDYTEVRARTGKVHLPMKGLTSGPYAIFLFHDENGDYDLNTRGETFLEGLGVSGIVNEHRGSTFDEASVMPGAVSIRVYYDE